MGFGADIDKFRNKAINKNKALVNYVCLNMANQIILLTPVDTGAAKNNWQSNIGSPNRSANSLPDKSGSGAKSQAEDKARQAYGGIFYFVNSLPYIKKLENGYSKQSPAGMVMVTIARFRNIFKRAIR